MTIDYHLSSMLKNQKNLLPEADKTGLYERIKVNVKHINNEYSRKFLLSIPMERWIRYAVGALEDTSRVENASTLIAESYKLIEENGFSKAYIRRLKNLIVSPLMKAFGNNKQKEGCKKTIEKIVLKAGERNILDAINEQPLVARGINERIPTKYKSLNKTISRLEKNINPYYSCNGFK